MRQNIPVKVSDVVEATVKEFGKTGDPILRYQKFILFLKDTKSVELNTLLKVRVTKICGTYGFCELVKDE